VVDHFNYDTISAAEQHDVLLVPRPDALRAGVTNFFKGTGKGGEIIAFPRAIGQELGNKSPLLTPVIKAPRTAYSYSPKDEKDGVVPEDLFASGAQLALVSVMQARNSARFTVVGSSELFEDTWFDAQVKRSVGLNGVGTDAKNVRTSNQAFAEEVTGWTFNEIGVLRVEKIEHHLDEKDARDSVLNPKIYRVKNDVVS
jgi:oligosaccharyltransferase complex subunit beta